jgi:histidine triad (HIT) family protein
MESRPDTWQVLEETDLTLAALTGTQFEVGQSLVIPRRHAPTLFDLTEEESVAIMSAARRIGRALVAALRPLGVLLYQNNGVYSGQEVPHFHLHVVPRQPGSDWGVGPPQLATLERRTRSTPRPLASAEQLRATADSIRGHLD